MEGMRGSRFGQKERQNYNASLTTPPPTQQGDLEQVLPVRIVPLWTQMAMSLYLISFSHWMWAALGKV